jgi:hypothetical protein
VDALHRNLEAVSDRLEQRLTALSEKIVDRIRSEVEEIRGFDGAELWETLRGVTRTALTTELDFMRHGRELPSTCPPDAAEAARLAAMARLPSTVVLQTHRIGHSVVWEAFVSATEELALPPARRTELLNAGSRFLFGYSDVLARFVDEEYQRELGRLRQGTEKQRVRAVIDVLEGREQMDDSLPYDLSLVHLGAVAWGPGALKALRALAQLLDRRLLALSPTGRTTWAWLGARAALSAAEEQQLVRFASQGARLAFGEPGGGVEGFRQTHRQALEAQRVGLRREAPVTRYRDVALESFAIRDVQAARQFLQIELGALGDTERARTLKETLRAYFACAQNTAATAAALGVHEQTVAQRIRAVEQTIGQPVNSRRAELETALRIERLIGTEPGAGSKPDPAPG